MLAASGSCNLRDNMRLKTYARAVVAKNIVNLNGMFANENEAIMLMKARTAKIPKGRKLKA